MTRSAPVRLARDMLCAAGTFAGGEAMLRAFAAMPLGAARREC